MVKYTVKIINGKQIIETTRNVKRLLNCFLMHLHNNLFLNGLTQHDEVE